MFRVLLALLRPLSAIAAELRNLRELYEADLASRPTPVYRVTEQLRKGDTEVTYAGEADERPLYKRWFQSEDEMED